MAGRSRDDRVTIPVVEERAVVRKHRKITGAVRVRTRVHEEEELVEEPFDSEEVLVERVPVERWVEAPVPIRREGDTTIVSLHEETVVVEKRLRVVEEIRLTKRQTTRHATERVVVRREEAVVERLDAADDEPA
ncbi:MAG TPA: YsnF/AvaK domain-containing protein [Geminicoccaceae bacterium]|nr:YsnF/AvaK domain-containing protein [Geminicoccaceae bacterium]